MTRKQKRMLWRILSAILLTALCTLLPTVGWVRGLTYLLPYLVIGYDILRKAVLGIFHGQVFDENFLMAVATVGALLLGFLRTGDYLEAVAVMLFYQIGELFQSVAVGKSRRSIGALMDIRPDLARVEREGVLCEVDPGEILPGEILLVRPGERIPIDGCVLEGSAVLDTAALTGESLPRTVTVGDEVISGCINQNGILRIRTLRRFEESTVARILDLVENATSRKSRSENFISRFAKYYTPAVCIGALLLGLLPPLLSLAVGGEPRFGEWLYRGLTFLVISCPCALVISIPLSFFAGIGGAARQGILVKGSSHLEALGSVETVVFDKTGTLTSGVFAVRAIHAEKIAPEELLRLAAHADCDSTHPIAQSIRNTCQEKIDRSLVKELCEERGGVTAVVDGHRIAVGSPLLMQRLGLSPATPTEIGSVAHVALDGRYVGCLVIADAVKESSADAIRALARAGIRRTVLLTGDRREVGEAVAAALGINEVSAELLPEDKVRAVEELLQSLPPRSKLAFVGDGINDAPVLARADLGIAMGAMGSDAAIEAADVVLMDDDPRKVARAIRIARRCMRIVRENILLALGVKALCLLLGALGIANLWLAIFADVGVMVLAVLNAIRALFLPSQSAKERSPQ